MQCETRKLLAGEEARARAFLRHRPLDNIILLGLINDYGLTHPFCRGTFYGHFRNGNLVGVALIGHHVVLSGGPHAVAAFAHIARRSRTDVHLMLGPETDAAAAFAPIFTGDGEAQPSYRCETQQLMVLSEVATDAAADALRPACAGEVAAMHALVCVEQTGIDPRAADDAGFSARVAGRIERGRVWIAEDEQGICFKTDVACETERIAYVEGVVTRPDVRGMGVGVRHLASLCRQLLQRNERVCLFVRAGDTWAGSLYEKVGFRLHRPYRFIRFLRERGQDFGALALSGAASRPAREALTIK
jgi:GNAT superfamily N-acetyltransferase